jgi:hypothetical protein
MSEIKVKSGKEADAKVVTVQYDIPSTVAGLVDKFGEEQVVAMTTRAVTLAIQANVRQKIAAGVADDALQATVDGWVPGVRAPASKKSPYERAEAALSNLSQDELHALMQQLKAKKGK